MAIQQVLKSSSSLLFSVFSSKTFQKVNQISNHSKFFFIFFIIYCLLCIQCQFQQLKLHISQWLDDWRTISLGPERYQLQPMLFESPNLRVSFEKEKKTNSLTQGKTQDTYINTGPTEIRKSISHCTAMFGDCQNKRNCSPLAKMDGPVSLK